MRMYSLFIFSAIALATVAHAKGFRRGQVPNGGQIGCVLCHVDPEGGGRLNVFGQLVEDGYLDGGNVVWGPALAALDADGDGVTNGEELLDPDGAWRPGDEPPGDPRRLSLPFDAASMPPTAIATATWAKIKGLFSERTE